MEAVLTFEKFNGFVVGERPQKLSAPLEKRILQTPPEPDRDPRRGI